MAKWLGCKCPECGGYGVVGRGFDLLPEDCPMCEGCGRLSISENDRVAVAPGAPFKGSCPGKYEQLKKKCN